MKKITLFALLLFGVACNTVQQPQPAPADLEALVTTYFTHFNQHEWTEMADMYSDTADFKDPSLGKGIVKQSKQQTVDKYKTLAGMFPNLHDRIEKIYVSGSNHVIVEFVSTGTAADQTAFELPICTVFRVEKGKITGDFTYFDNSQ